MSPPARCRQNANASRNAFAEAYAAKRSPPSIDDSDETSSTKSTDGARSRSSRIDHADACDLRRELPPADIVVGLPEGTEGVARHKTGAVDDAVQCAESGLDGVECAGHRLPVAGVGLHDEHLAAQRLNPPQPPNPSGDRIGGRVLRQVRVPLGVRWHPLRPVRQSRACAVRARYSATCRPMSPRPPVIR